MEMTLDLNPIMLAAGAEIMRIYATDFAVVTKADASPVTEADKSAEAIILAGLKHLAPGIPIIAEEEAAAGRFPTTAGTFFLVDPLDGTKEFISKNGEFTVNIALIEDGRPVLGAVYAPAIGKIWWGAAGKGAFMADVTDGVIGKTDLLIYPFGARPTAAGARLLRKAGFPIQFDIDVRPIRYRLGGATVMSRLHIDGFAFQDPQRMKQLFSVRRVIDPLRPWPANFPS